MKIILIRWPLVVAEYFSLEPSKSINFLEYRMKKLLAAATIAAMTVSGGAWAACSAAIDMGGNPINNVTMSTGSNGEVATKAYVDAATGGALNCGDQQPNSSRKQAIEGCRNMEDGSYLPTLHELYKACGMVDNHWVTDVAYIAAEGKMLGVTSNIVGTQAAANVEEVFRPRAYRCVK